MTTRQVTFTLPAHIAKNATSGILLGDFNNWNLEKGIPLQQNENGDLTATIELISGEYYQYRYFLNDGRWENDDRALHYEFSHFTQVDNCVVFVNAAEEYLSEHESPEVQNITPPKKSSKTETAKKTAVTSSATSKNIVTSKEDLSVLKSVSKNVANLLNQKGINSFSKLGKSTIKSLKELLEDAGPKFEKLDPSTWPKEAKEYIKSQSKKD